MTLYGLFKLVSEILTPRTNSLYDYMIHTFDDNGGFLRTRHCYWDEAVPDHPVPEAHKVLICFKKPFREGDEYYESERFGEDLRYEQKNTLVKMQLFYASENIEDDIAWSCLFPYPVVCIIDLENGCFEERQCEGVG